MRTGVNKILVVGGGDSGLLTALAIERLNPDIDLTVVDDFSQDTPEVGKSTFIKILNILHGFLGIDEQRFIQSVNPIWKGSVYFRDWCGKPPFHFPFDVPDKFSNEGEPDQGAENYLVYQQLAADNKCFTRGENLVERRASPFYLNKSHNRYERYAQIAYHLDVKRFNAFLRTICTERDIRLVDDRISDVTVRNGEVCSISGENSIYHADLFIDATGFDRILKGKLDTDFRAFDLPLDRALNTRFSRSLDEAIPATIVESGDFGWFWQIDTYDQRDVGYVFSSEFASRSEALDEFITKHDGTITASDVILLKFDTGYYRKAWIGNCVSIGNAQGFVEPLQSTGLTANAWAAQSLSYLLSSVAGNVNSHLIETYNQWVAHLWESIGDFISLHYACSSGSTAFWKEVQSISVSERLQLLIDEYDERGFASVFHPIDSTPHLNAPLVFKPINFYLIMNRMGRQSNFYESNDIAVDEGIRERVNQKFDLYRTQSENYLSIPTVYSELFSVDEVN